MSEYLGAYPHLKIARRWEMKYPVVLALAEWKRDGCPPRPFDPRYAGALESYFVHACHWPAFMDEMSQQIELATKHFGEQQCGRRSMDGIPL